MEAKDREEKEKLSNELRALHHQRENLLIEKQ